MCLRDCRSQQECRQTTATLSRKESADPEGTAENLAVDACSYSHLRPAAERWWCPPGNRDEEHIWTELRVQFLLLCAALYPLRGFRHLVGMHALFSQ